MAKIDVQGYEVTVLSVSKENFIFLTDIAKYHNPDAPADIVKNWMRTRSTIEFLGLSEQLNNPDFKQVEFDLFRDETGANHFVLSPQKWIETTGTIGLISKSGTKPIQKSEFESLKKWWPKRKTSEQAWKVNFKSFNENGFNLDIRNSHTPKEEHRYSSSEMLTLLHESFQKSDELPARLKKELAHG